MPDLSVGNPRENTITIELDADPNSKGWLAAATRPLHDGTAKQVSLWIAFITMAVACLVSLSRIPWRQRTERRFHVLPLIITLCSAVFYFLIAMGYSGESTCQSYHLASLSAKNKPDDWQPGAVDGRAHLEVCRAPAGLDGWPWRFILSLWIGQFITHATGSLSSGSAAFGMMTPYHNNHGVSGPYQWASSPETWLCVCRAFFIARSTYQMAIHRDVQARKFFFFLASYVCTLYATQGL